MRRIRSHAGRLCVALALGGLVLLTGCVQGGPRFPGGDALRVGELAERGDAARRASTRLVLRGLDAEIAGRAGQATSDFERAIQVDPTNPLPYLALARQEAFGGSPDRALAFVDKARAAFGAAAESLGARPHLDGLRGAALAARGERTRARPFRQAAAEASSAWADGILDAHELR